jgi:hypothetical protein
MKDGILVEHWLIENENLLLLRFFPSIPLPAAWRAICGCRTSSAAVILQE